MNWIKRIRFILGAFWYRMFADQDFLLGVEYLLGVFFRVTGYKMDNWVAGMFPMLPAVYPSDMPYVIYLDVSSLHKEWYSWQQFVNQDVQLHEVTPEEGDSYWEVGGPDDEDYLATEGAGKGWVVDIVEPVPEPSYMMNHLYKWTLTLTNGPDFKFAGNQILFYKDPTLLNLPSVKVTTKDGELKVYWKLICTIDKTVNYYSAVSGFMSPELNDCADVVWDIHQNGATYYNAKKLLAAVTDGVVCDEDGAINERWEEQGWTFLRVEDKIYGSKETCNYNAGASVKKGDILFGSMKFYKGSENPDSASIPGIRVRTDAGELVAENTDKRVVQVSVSGSTFNVLPLTGDVDTLVDYLNICIRNSMDPRCPSIKVEDPNETRRNNGIINPYKFVMQTLRKGRTCAVRLTATSVSKLEAAIQVLRKSTNLGGLITMYVKDSSETANVTVSGFTADAGMGVVAVDATVTVQGKAAEARILP